MRVYVIIFPWTSLSGVKLTSTFLSVRYNMPDPAVSCLAVRLKSWGQVCKPWWCSRTSYLGLCCWGGFCACFYLLSRLPILQNLFLGVHLLVSLQNIAHMVPWQAEDFLACLNVNQSCDNLYHIKVELLKVSCSRLFVNLVYNQAKCNLFEKAIWFYLNASSKPPLCWPHWPDPPKCQSLACYKFWWGHLIQDRAKSSKRDIKQHKVGVNIEVKGVEKKKRWCFEFHNFGLYFLKEKEKYPFLLLRL